MRRYGVENAYEQLKELTRGRRVDGPALRAFIAELQLPAEPKQQLLALSPSTYVGLAAQLAQEI
jgi:adenylosuccinate lyase